MKLLKFVVLLIALSACGSKEVKEEKAIIETPAPAIVVEQPVAVQTVAPTPSKSVQRERDYNYELLDTLIKESIKELDQTYASSPFYMLLDDQRYYVVSNTAWTYNTIQFIDGIKYGIVDSSYASVLPMNYDKIYNPNLTLAQCLEVKKGDKVGLYNYHRQTILPPQFDYIIPHKDNRKQVAYGLKEGSWFEISSDLKTALATDFSPVESIKALSFSVKDIGNNYMYMSYNESSSNDRGMGKGVVILPSYLERLQLFRRSYYDDIILPQQNGYNSGTTAADIVNTRQVSITDKILSFFVSIYEEGIDARGYTTESEELVIYNNESQQTNTYHLGLLSQYDQLCRDSGYRVLFDSLIEVKRNGFHERELAYEFAPIYEYHKVSSKGELLALKSNRHFDFTKFALINEEYFQGCYAKPMEKPTNRANYWKSDHLTIEELDIMRNEIFADYGYRFKTKKWQQFFAKKHWYKPQYDDVNHLLSAIDKANIKTILRVKASMQGKEQEVVNKQAIGYAPAG